MKSFLYSTASFFSLCIPVVALMQAILWLYDKYIYDLGFIEILSFTHFLVIVVLSSLVTFLITIVINMILGSMDKAQSQNK